MRYEFTDDSGDSISIRPLGDPSVHADVKTDRAGCEIPQHEVPRAARALYEAAGLPVPDLPDIPDPEQVAALARDLCEVATDLALTDDHADAASNRAYIAAGLLARGWGRTA